MSPSASISCSCCQRHSKRLSNPALESPSRWQLPRMSVGASLEGYKLFPWVPICDVPTRGAPESFSTWSVEIGLHQWLFFLRGTVHRCLLSIKKGRGQHSHLTVDSDDNSLFLVCGNKPRYDIFFLFVFEV